MEQEGLEELGGAETVITIYWQKNQFLIKKDKLFKI